MVLHNPLYIVVYTQCSFLQFAYFHCLAKGMEAFSSDPTALIPDLLVLKWGLEMHCQTLTHVCLAELPTAATTSESGVGYPGKNETISGK